MGAVDKGLLASRKAVPAAGARTGTRAAPKKANPVWIGFGALAGILLGAGGAYALASMQFDEQLAAMTQATDMQIIAGKQRVQELEDQLQQMVEQTAAQQHEIVQQAKDQARALSDQATQSEREVAPWPELPVRVWVRRAFLGSGMVAQMHNYGQKELALAVTAHSGARNAVNTWHVAIAPNGTLEIGTGQGWTFAAGDEIDLAGEGFRPMTFHVRPRAKQPPALTVTP